MTVPQNFERDFRRPALDALVLLTVAKSLRLREGELDLGDFADSCARVDHRDIFEREKDLYRGRSRLAVLGTCLMFVCDYAPGLIDLRRASELSGFGVGA